MGGEQAVGAVGAVFFSSAVVSMEACGAQRGVGGYSGPYDVF